MDLWLLLCMGFVALALFEYAVLLTIRFGKQHKITADKRGNKSDVVAENRCRKIDRYALRAFLTLFSLSVGTYFYNIHSQSS